MRSKIERLEDIITDRGHLVAGIEPASNQQLQEKINEIIDHLNSQDQEEECRYFNGDEPIKDKETIEFMKGLPDRVWKDTPEEKECECCKWDDMGYTHEPNCPLFREVKNTPEENKFRVELSEGVRKWFYEDTPEEWEEGLWDIIERFGPSFESNLVEEVNNYIKQLLNEREDKAREEGRREQRELDCSLYGSACAEENFDEKWRLEFGMTEEEELDKLRQ